MIFANLHRITLKPDNTMKKIVTLFLTFFASCVLFAQVTTNPVFITQSYGETFEVIFDASQGGGAMKGAPNCYAHTGVMLKGDNKWSHATDWGDNSDKYKLESIDTDKWKLTVTGGVKSFYDMSKSETATKLLFVFRTKDQNTQSEDLEYVLYEDGKQGINIEGVEANGAYYVNSDIDITFSAIIKADLLIEVNGVPASAAYDENTLSYTFHPTETGTYKLGFYTSDDEGVTASEEFDVYVINPTEEKPLPDGMVEGINYNQLTKEATFVIRAPLSEDIFMIGDFNGWLLNEDYHMYRYDVQLDGETAPTRLFWRTIKFDEPTKKYAYQYFVDGKVKISDPYTKVVLDPWNDSRIPSTHLQPNLPKLKKTGLGYDGLVSVLELEDDDPYEWSAEGLNFKIENPKDLVIYELLVRDFSNKQTLVGVLDSLDYLKRLGINAIELMPVCEFDGNDSWGYNPNHFFAYDKFYGARNLYKEFIDICHQNGIAVIVDMVFNHATSVFPYAKLYLSGNDVAENNPWFNRVAKHPANVFNDFNHEYPGTRKYFKEVLKFWIEEYHVDGYRMDLSKGFTQKYSKDYDAWGKYDESRVAIIKDYYDAVRAASANAVFILEHLAEYKEDKELSDYGCIPWRNMSNAYQQSAMGYPSNSKFVDRDGSVEGGMFTDGWVGYGESHDEERCFYKAKAYGDGNLKTDSVMRFARIPMNVAFEMLIPGPKMMWQFGEMGYDYSINWCTNGKISDDCRTYKKLSPWSAKLKWQDVPERMKAYFECCKVISLRTAYPEIFRKETFKSTNCAGSSFNEPRRMDFTYVDSVDPDNSVTVIVWGNFNASASLSVSGDFPSTGVWYDYMNGTPVSVSRKSKVISLQPGELKIYTSRPLETPVSVSEYDFDENSINVYPTATEDYVFVISKDDVTKIDVYNFVGAKVAGNESSNGIDLSSLAKGTYLMQVFTSSEPQTFKIIKK